MNFAAELRRYVIAPTLDYLNHGGKAAIQIVEGTMAAESGFVYLHQQDKGPGLGFGQMERRTHDWLWSVMLKYHTNLASDIMKIAPKRYLSDVMRHPSVVACVASLEYATAMVRARYLVVEEALPVAGDLNGQARYWKKYYNTAKGAGTVWHYKRAYNELILGHDTK